MVRARALSRCGPDVRAPKRGQHEYYVAYMVQRGSDVARHTSPTVHSYIPFSRRATDPS